MHQPHPSGGGSHAPPSAGIAGSRRGLRLSTLCLLSLLILPVSHAATAATLGEAVDAALTLAEQGQRADAQQAVGDAVRAKARGLLADNPALRVKLLSDQFTGDDGAYEVEAMVDLPLLLPGQRSARFALADATGAAADALCTRLRWEMAGVVRELVWEAALAEGRLRQAEAALAAAEALEATVAKREAAGELARLDLLLARQDTLARQSELAAARAEQTEAMAAYQALTGLAELPVPLAESPAALSGAGAADDPSDAHNAAGAAQLPAAIAGTHPLLASLRQGLARARAERGRVRADRSGTPLLSLGVKHARAARSAPEDDALQLEVSMPFGVRSASAPAMAEAEQGVTDQLAELQQARRELLRGIAAARAAVSGAQLQLAAARARVEVTEGALALARRAFDLGEGDLTALLRAQERAREARLDLALRQLAQGRAISRLNQALGVLPQ
ncbi:TolC family protein [uncultured Thiohalocapsa sp.]|uniref:TolC family protein n=1 Tax=uncultured Thiohalocapsa sp. TaxID=768990 RepID=UPI0025DD8668|nr:TolC family protein [uncultured Thiohalocapsa sp.]